MPNKLKGDMYTRLMRKVAFTAGIAPAVELRERGCGEDKEKHLVGYAAVFNTPAYGEQIAPSAFNKTLADGADVRGLWNHDTNIVLGRTKAGTLSLAVDERGLKYDITLPEWAANYYETVARGDVDQSSFGFWPEKYEVKELEDGSTLVTHTEVRLFDVSPVANPWYADTEVEACSRDMREAVHILREVRNGKSLTDVLAMCYNRQQTEANTEQEPQEHSSTAVVVDADVVAMRLNLLKAREAR